MGLLDVFTPATSLENFQDLYLVTHLMGADLNNIIRQQALSDDHVQFLVYQILRGLKVDTNGLILYLLLLLTKKYQPILVSCFFFRCEDSCFSLCLPYSHCLLLSRFPVRPFSWYCPQGKLVTLTISITLLHVYTSSPPQDLKPSKRSCE